MKKLILHNINKSYERGVPVLKDISLSVAKGDFVVLLGPSGSGKSTILSIIAGFEQQTSGDVIIDGINCNQVPCQKREIAMVFQNYALYPSMNVYNNIAFPLVNKHEKRTVINQKVSEISKALHIEDILRKKAIDEEIQKILLANGRLVSNYDTTTVTRNFDDESAFIKRGQNIFELSNEDWVEVGTMTSPNLSHSFLINKMIEFASQMDIKLYENGILLKGDGEQNLIVFKDIDENNNPRYRFMSSQPVLPSIYLKDIENFISLVGQTVIQQTVVPNSSKLYPIAEYSINALVYNDTELEYENPAENVYSVEFTSQIGEDKSTEDLSQITSKMQCSDINNALTISKKIMSGKRKVLTNE